MNTEYQHDKERAQILARQRMITDYQHDKE